MTSVALGAGLAGMAFGPTRSLLDRVLPKPGEGPSEEAQAAGRFRMEVTGEATNGARYRTTVAAPYDPDTAASTAVEAVGAALALLEDGDALPDAAGVLTPATAIGMPPSEDCASTSSCSTRSACPAEAGRRARRGWRGPVWPGPRGASTSHW